MSRPYRIVVQKVVEQEISAGDQSKVRLKLDQVLGEEPLDEILGEVLSRNGWTETSDGVYEKERGDGETMSCDLDAKEVTTTIRIETTVREEIRREVRGDTWNWRQMREMTDEEMEQVRRREEQQIEATISESQQRQASEALAEQVRERLEQAEPERRQEINRVVLEVMSEALKRKAAELGNVERVDEKWDGEDYEMTISISE